MKHSMIMKYIACAQTSLTLLATALAASVVPLPAHAETRALLVGVWTFNSPIFANLKGPQNDLAAMESVVRGEGATDVTVLRDRDVTRTSVETALHALGMRSKPGDWIVFYYSGHGAEADAVVKGTADGDTDQFVPLPGFDEDKQDPERFIVDKDFYSWMARYVAPDVHILMIADTCHSGTLNRSIDPASFRFTPRTGFRGGGDTFVLVPHPGPRFALLAAGADTVVGAAGGGNRGGGDTIALAPNNASAPAVPHAIDRPDLANLIYIGGAQDKQLAEEAGMPVSSAPSRGVMTWTLEKGLTTPGKDGKHLAADGNQDGKVTPAELGEYLGSQVRMLTGQRQEPKTTFVGAAGDLPLFAAVPVVQPAVAPVLPGVFTVAAAGAGVVAPTPDLPWRAVASREQADFIWDRTTGKVFHRSGDMVAQDVAGAPALRGVIEKWNAVEALRPLMNESRVRVTIGPKANGARYAPGAKVAIDLHYGGKTSASGASTSASGASTSASGASTSASAGYATIFNLASDGTVQRLYPLTDDDGDGQLGPGGTLPLFQNTTVAPFGTDHVVALVLPQPPVALRAMLRSIDGQRLAARVVGPIRELLAHDGAMSIGELYTGL